MQDKYHRHPLPGPQPVDDMPDLPPRRPASEQQQQAPTPQKIRRVRKVRRSQVGQIRKQQHAPRPIPRNAASQPRDHLGRFASFAGRAIVGTAKGIVRTVKAADRTATNLLQDITNTRPRRKGRTR